MHSHTKFIVPLLLCFGVILLQNEPSYAFNIRELLGLEKADETQNDQTDDKTHPAREEPKPDTSAAGKKPSAEKNTWAKPADESQQAQNKLDFDYINNIISNLNQEQRKEVLADEQVFRQFVQQEADSRSVISAAIANKLDRDGNTVFLMQRGAENILRESYLNRLIMAKIPNDFPTEQQVKEYYEKNKDKFVIGKRMHVWQIFLPIEKDMDNKAKTKLKQQAGTIINDINKGKIDFASAAAKHSNHEASRNNGGYMGLIKLADLIPGVEKPLMGLKEGKLSKPIETEAGIHILKRGTLVEEQQIELAQVEVQIRQLLRKQAVAQLRMAIFEQAKKSYPIDLKDNRTEEWRLRLRTNIQARTNSPAE
jgi:parvulin-like peptidyl-prolyl isomerase